MSSAPGERPAEALSSEARWAASMALRPDVGSRERLEALQAERAAQAAETTEEVVVESHEGDEVAEHHH